MTPPELDYFAVSLEVGDNEVKVTATDDLCNEASVVAFTRLNPVPVAIRHQARQRPWSSRL